MLVAKHLPFSSWCTCKGRRKSATSIKIFANLATNGLHLSHTPVCIQKCCMLLLFIYKYAQTCGHEMWCEWSLYGQPVVRKLLKNQWSLVLTATNVDNPPHNLFCVCVWVYYEQHRSSSICAFYVCVNCELIYSLFREQMNIVSLVNRNKRIASTHRAAHSRLLSNSDTKSQRRLLLKYDRQ